MVHPVRTAVSVCTRRPPARRPGGALAMTASIAIAGLLLAACGGASSPTASAGGSAGAKMTPVSVALALDPPKMIFIGFYVANDEGFFRKNGLSVTLEPELSGVQAARAVAAGAAVFSAGGTDAVAASASEGGGQIAIWSYGKDDLSLISPKSITSVSQLRGKNIGLGDATGPAYQLSALALEQAGVPLSSVHFDILNGRPALVGALVAGQIDATAFHIDDGLTALSKDANLHILRPMYDSAPNYWYGGVSIPTKYGQAHRATVVAFLKAMVEADRWMYTHKSAVVNIGIKYTGESPQVVSEAYDFLASNHLWTENVGMTDQQIRYTLNLYLQSKTITRIPTLSQIFDPSYIDAALGQLGRVSD